MMTIKAGEFWLAEIQYTNGTDAKRRAVLILWLDGLDAIGTTGRRFCDTVLSLGGSKHKGGGVYSLPRTRTRSSGVVTSQWASCCEVIWDNLVGLVMVGK